MRLITTGIDRGDGTKDYRIQYDGNEWIARRRGQRFECGGMVGTIKEIKDAIASGELAAKSFAGVDDEESLEDGVVESAPRKSTMWDCVAPCALLVLAFEKLGPCPELGPDFQRAVRETLDCHGYLGPQGELEHDTAVREWNRIEGKRPMSAIVVTEEAASLPLDIHNERAKTAQQHLIDQDERDNREALGQRESLITKVRSFGGLAAIVGMGQ